MRHLADTDTATVTPLVTPMISGVHVIIDRNVSVTDDYGVVMESRCEISLLVEEVGDVGRGALVDTGQPNDQWRLLEPLGSDGIETRWTAGRV